MSRAGNGWESSPKAWQRGRFCRGGGGAFSFPPSPGKPRCLLPSGELHRSPQASGGHPQPLSSASSESSPRPRARGKGRAGWESTEGGARSHLPSVPGARCQPLRVSLPGDALLPAPTGWQQPPAAPAGHPLPRVGLPRAFFSEPVCGRGAWGEESRWRGCVAAVAVRPSSLTAGLGSASPSCDASASSSSPNREQKCLSHTSASPPAAAAAPLASRALPPGPAAAPGAGAPPAGF